MEGNNNNNSTVNNDPGHSNKKYRGKDAIPDRDATKKKLAQQGQWQTPPLPVFAARAYTTAVTAPVPTAVGTTASGAASTATTATATATATTAAAATTAATAATATSNTTAKIPTTPDEYARMLQEAYKRGAEAGARAQHPGTNQRQQQQQQQQHSTVATVTAVDMPPPTIQHVAPTAAAAAAAASVQGMGVVPRTTLTQNIQYAPATVPSGGSSGGPTTVVTAQQHQHHHQQQQQQQQPPSSSISNSKSLPDMSSYQGTLSHPDDEEDKRKKRLARNRASARLRRLKKKNLVDSYEGEVGILEAALSKLRSHRWGSVSSSTSATSGGSSTPANVDNHEALIEALSMERGQQPLTPEKRRELIQSIVAQQREQVNNLLDVQLENWMLSALAESGGNSSSTATATPTTTTTSTTMARESIAGSNGDATNQQQQQPPPNEELDQITTELQSILQLTPEQLSLISESSRGCAHEVRDLFTVDDCLRSIHDNQWLLDEGVDEVAGEFTSILNPSQLSKFLVWSDHNADQIEKLDYVNVTAGVGNGPVFEFGVDEGLEHGD